VIVARRQPVNGERAPQSPDDSGAAQSACPRKHRFYSLGGPDVASALEGHDHLAGTLGVRLHDPFGRWDGLQQDQSTITRRTMLARSGQRISTVGP
jgi:hypothetical protein